MARWTKNWNKRLAKDLKNPQFAREFPLAAVEEGVSLRAINPRHNPTQGTINRLLNPFGLKLSLTAIEMPKRRNAA
jgi:hypothetical protein